ncbi:hypothetical protein BVRB_029080, partial [Beta vulgaris subsp. vulgaris]
SNGYAYFLADLDSDGVGSLNVGAANVTVLSSLPVFITAADVVLQSDCFLNLGFSPLRLRSTGSRGFNLCCPCNSLGDFVSLCRAELRQISAKGSWTITSYNISVFSINVLDIPSDVYLVSPAVGGAINFFDNAEFSSLNASSVSGINIYSNISSLFGSVVLDGDSLLNGSGSTLIHASANLMSNKNLLLHQRSGGSVNVSAPVLFSASKDVGVFAPVYISGQGRFSSISQTGAFRCLQSGSVHSVSANVTSLMFSASDFLLGDLC